MDWKEIISSKTADGGLWLLAVFDRFSKAFDELEWWQMTSRKPNLKAALAMLVRLARALARLVVQSLSLPPEPQPLGLPAAGLNLTPRLLPTPDTLR